MSYQDFFDAYVECLLWSSTDDDGDPLDAQYSTDDLAPEALTEIEQDCKAFYEAHFSLWNDQIDDAQAGHDFYLTRNRHGAGFWDRGLGDLGEELTELSRQFGTQGAYVGDDGKVYVHG
jgi:hypothetical protein